MLACADDSAQVRTDVKTKRGEYVKFVFPLLTSSTTINSRCSAKSQNFVYCLNFCFNYAYSCIYL